MRAFTLASVAALAASPALAATQSFVIELTEEDRSPDGYTRMMRLANGTSPGPPLMANQGDSIEFLVRNKMQSKTAIHFHGIEQIGTPWSDGAPGLSQKPIPAGGDFLYKWLANEYGTFFYHSHEKSQVMDGLYGAIYIQPTAATVRPFDKISNHSADITAMKIAERNPYIVGITDWTHLTSTQFQAMEKKSNIDNYCSNSILINGKGRITCLPEEELEKQLSPSTRHRLNGAKVHPNGCSPFIRESQGSFTTKNAVLPGQDVWGCQETKAPLEVFNVDRSQAWASFNFISGATVQTPVVSIDEHPLWIYAVDGRYIVPQLAQGVQIFSGERYSAMVKLDKRPGSQYKMRVSNIGFNQVITGFATVKYLGTPSSKSKSTPFFSYGGNPVSENVTMFNTSSMIPFPNIPPSRTSDKTFVMAIDRTTAPWRWTLLGNESYPDDYASSQPMLYYPESAKAKNSHFVLRTTNGTWVDLIWTVAQDKKSPFSPPHPIHKHSNKGYVIGTGTGAFNWTSVAAAAKAIPQSFNFDTPALRDTFVTPPALNTSIWVAMRYQVINPGAFLVHCHNQAHFAGGMGIAILDAVNDFPPVPPEYGPNGNGIRG